MSWSPFLQTAAMFVGMDVAIEMAAMEGRIMARRRVRWHREREAMAVYFWAVMANTSMGSFFHYRRRRPPASDNPTIKQKS